MDSAPSLAATLEPQYLAGSIICIILVILSVFLRLIAQRSIGRINAPDNWIIVVAAVCYSHLLLQFVADDHL